MKMIFNGEIHRHQTEGTLKIVLENFEGELKEIEFSPNGINLEEGERVLNLDNDSRFQKNSKKV